MVDSWQISCWRRQGKKCNKTLRQEKGWRCHINKQWRFWIPWSQIYLWIGKGTTAYLLVWALRVMIAIVSTAVCRKRNTTYSLLARDGLMNRWLGREMALVSMRSQQMLRITIQTINFIIKCWIPAYLMASIAKRPRTSYRIEILEEICRFLITYISFIFPYGG
jgi:hypothetical protein